MAKRKTYTRKLNALAVEKLTIVMAGVSQVLLADQIDCDALRKAGDAISSLLAEHCPIAQPMRQATKKKVSVKK